MCQRHGIHVLDERSNAFVFRWLQFGVGLGRLIRHGSDLVRL